MSIQKLYLIGHPVAHSLSPSMHNEFIKQKGLNLQYEAIDVLDKDLDAFILQIKDNASPCIGFNVTSPYKVKIIEYLDKLDDTAKLTGSVNTVLIDRQICERNTSNGDYLFRSENYGKNRKNHQQNLVEKKSLKGYNTDVYGFLYMMEINGEIIKNKNIVIFGTGGAARAVASACHIKSAKNIYIVSRDRATAQQFIIQHISRHGNDIKYIPMDYKEFNQAVNNHITFHIIINATPLGMTHLSDTMVDINFLNIDASITAIDLIYNPKQTKFLYMAEKNGNKTINGFDMLRYQGIKAFKLWTN